MNDPNETKINKNDGSGGVIPIVDSHCHIFGQTLYEGSDLIRLVKNKVAFFHYSMELDMDNTRKALRGVPEENRNADGSYSQAIVPLHMDLAYTPYDHRIMEIFNLGYRTQCKWKEHEVIALTDNTRIYPDKSKLATLNLHSLYCTKREDLIGDDRVRIEVYNGPTLIKVLSDIIIDHKNTTRILNTDIHFVPEEADIRIKMYEQDIGVDDLLGHESIPLEDSCENWQFIEFINGPGARCDTSYTLTYRYSPPLESDERRLPAGVDWVLELMYTKCIEKQDLVSPFDTIRIEVNVDDEEDPIKVPKICCKSGSTYAVNKKIVFKESATIRFWELDSAGRNNFGDTDDLIGDAVTVSAEEVMGKVVSFSGKGGKYELVYSVIPGEPGPKEDKYYKEGEDYIWFKRDPSIYRGTVHALSRMAAHFPGEVWPFVPFDPRRPYGLEVVKEAIEELGFVGVKLYSRCGWMPWNNCEIYGDELGQKLDARLQELYEYVTVNDLPILNHTSPTGYPLNTVLAFPSKYEKAYAQKSDRPTESFNGPGFPPFWELAQYPSSIAPKKALLHMIAEECGTFAKYCHYVQKTVAPHIWEPALKEFPNLRLTFAHSGSGPSIYARYKDILEEFIKQDSEFKKAFEDSFILSEEGFSQNCFVADGDMFKAGFIRKITMEVAKKFRVLFSGFSKDEVRREVENFCNTGDWGEWFMLWANAYPTDWTSKIIEYEGAYANVYSDIAYISSSEDRIFVKLVNLLAEDAVKGIKPGGENMVDKHLIGTDWFMTETDGISLKDCWDRARKGLEIDGSFDATLWKKWSSENTLNWLNLGPQMDKLEAFYKKYMPKGRDPVTEKEIKIPVWWAALRNYYERE